MMFPDARDPNNATWYVLRYGRDFTPRPTMPPWLSPILGPELFYDDDRHLLELLPIKPATEVQPLPGLAVDVDGEIYKVDPIRGTVIVRHCNGCEADLLCEPDVFATPGGLALDRRGYLYVADPVASRVVVVLPDDGHVAGVMADGLTEPVDVAVAPDGSVFVADRAAGLIVVFNARLERCGQFVPRDREGLPAAPRPIAVMIDADGAVLVADATHPRLLRFTATGQPLADVELHAVVQQLEGGAVALDALERAYGAVAPRFLAAACRPCRPARDGGERLAAVHRALRLLLLRLGGAFEACGTFVSAVLDGGAPGVEWHKIEIDADLPAGTWLKIQTVTADAAADLDGPPPVIAALPFQPPEDLSSCTIKPFAPSDVPDRLVQSPPGRYLRLRLVLGSDGSATPSVRAIRIYYPRVSYLDLLPRVYRRDADSARFLEQFLALFEHVFTDVESRYEQFSRELNPDAAPLDVITWLGCLIDLSFDPAWPLERRRKLVAAAMELYRTRGTIAGIERYVEIYTGVRPVIVEGFLERPLRPPFLGRAGHVLGAATALTPTSQLLTADEWLLQRYAHRFDVLVYLTDECDEALTLGVVDRIVTTSKPAHTVHRLTAVRAEAEVGAARVGLDLLLGSRGPRTMAIGGCPVPGAPPGPPAALGVDSILGEKRPQYLKPIGLTLS